MGYGAAQTFVAALQNLEDVPRQGLMTELRALETKPSLVQEGLVYDGSEVPPLDRLDLDHYQGGRHERVDTG